MKYLLLLLAMSCTTKTNTKSKPTQANFWIKCANSDYIPVKDFYHAHLGIGITGLRGKTTYIVNTPCIITDFNPLKNKYRY